MDISMDDKIQHAENSIKQCPPELYFSEGLPDVVRHYLADWIENRVLPCNLSTSNPDDADEIAAIYSEFMAELDYAAETVSDPLVQYELRSAHNELQRLSQTPGLLYRILKERPAQDLPLIATEQSNHGLTDSFMNSKKPPSENNTIWCCCSRSVSPTVKNNQNTKIGVLTLREKSSHLSNQKPVDIPKSVRCSKLIAALEKYFMRKTNCRRGFTPTNRAFLRSKLLRHAAAESEDPLVNLKRLSQSEDGCGFTFCKWFTGIIEIVNAHLWPYWENGYIVGFIDRLSAEELLSMVPHDGAFIVRFSESVLSSITLSYVLKIGNESITASLEPFTCDQLKSLSLPEISFGRIYHRQARKCLTMVYFYGMRNGCEVLTCEHKSIAFPPLLNKEKAEKPTAPNSPRYVQYDQVLVAANPEDAEATENFHSDLSLTDFQLERLRSCSLAEEELIALSATSKF